MSTADFIIALRNDITGELKKEILDELRPFIDQQLNHNVFDLKEAMQYLKVSESTIRKMIGRGEVPFFKQGGQYFFRQSSLNQWMDELERQNLKVIYAIS